jgi:NADPH-dependent 2,4-dienoyl-CoA reductase/sulfur reductase-like enzyme
MEAARVAAERGHRVTLAEAGPQLGGAFRLAGLQPRRSQIFELIEWYERQLRKLGVNVRLNAPIDGEEVKAFGAQRVIVATGSLPAMNGFQRAIPQQERLTGVGLANVWSIEDVMGKLARPGKRVLLIDDTGDWRGAGTAWHLAEQGHEVTIVTGWPMVGFWIQRTAGDGKLRSRLAQLGASWKTESVLVSWQGKHGVVRNLLNGEESQVDADALVLATTNLSETGLADELSQLGLSHTTVGDTVSPRLAVHAIYEGRAAAMKL